MITNILIVLAAVLVILVVIIVRRPSDFQVTRSAKISAPAAEVFSHVNDFHQWEAWSPWAKRDPEVRNTYEGPPAGPGAIFSWSGNRKVGAGRMMITDSRPSDLIRIKLDFLKPFKATNTTEFTFKPEGQQTVVTWNMFGEANFLSKAFGLFVDCDKMVGSDFEQGLANLKSVAEAAVRPATPPAPTIGTAETEKRDQETHSA